MERKALQQAAELRELAFRAEFLGRDRYLLNQNLHGLSSVELAATAEALLQSERGRSMERVLNDVCFEWGQRDPKTALAFADAIQNRSLRTACARRAFQGWAEADWLAARAWLAEQPAGALQDLLATGLVEVVAVRHPNEALRIFLEEFGRGRRMEPWHMMARCAPQAPAASIKAWEQLPPGPIRDSARNSLARYWGKADPEAAWQWASSLRGERDRLAAQEAVVWGALHSYPESAAAFIARAPDHPGLAARFAHEVEAKKLRNPDGGLLAAGDPPDDSAAREVEPDDRIAPLLELASSHGYLRGEAQALIREINSLNDAGLAAGAALLLLDAAGQSNARRVLAMLCAVWGRMDPSSAMAFVETIPDRALRENCRGQAFRGWAEADWPSARGWLEAQPPQPGRNRLEDNLMEVVAVLDPLAALTMVEKALAENNERRIPTVMRISATLAPEATSQTWEKLPPGKGKDAALNPLAQAWGGIDPERAWQWASKLAAHQGGVDARRSIVRGAAQQDLNAALALVLQAPDEERQDLFAAVASFWGSKSPEVAVKWAADLPQDIRAGVVSAALRGAGTAAPDDPQSLLSVALELPEGRDRHQAVSRALHFWSRQNFAAVREWLINQPQSPDSPLFLTILSRLLAEQDPELLVELFNQLPEDERTNPLRFGLRRALQDFNPEFLPQIEPFQ